MFEAWGNLLGLPPPNPLIMAAIVGWFVYRVFHPPRRPPWK